MTYIRIYSDCQLLLNNAGVLYVSDHKDNEKHEIIEEWAAGKIICVDHVKNIRIAPTVLVLIRGENVIYIFKRLIKILSPLELLAEA